MPDAISLAGLYFGAPATEHDPGIDLGMIEGRSIYGGRRTRKSCSRPFEGRMVQWR